MGHMMGVATPAATGTNCFLVTYLLSLALAPSAVGATLDTVPGPTLSDHAVEGSGPNFALSGAGASAVWTLSAPARRTRTLPR